MKNTNKRSGFTLVELVIVIGVIAILAGVLIPTFSNVIQKAKDSKDLQEAINIYKEQALVLKADNALTDRNSNNKEEVLVVLREGQSDEKYYLFVDGKAEVKETSPQDNEYDVKISGGSVTPGEEVKVYTLTKVTSISQLENKVIILGVMTSEGMRIALPITNRDKLQTIAIDSTITEERYNEVAKLTFVKDGEYYNIMMGAEYLSAASDNKFKTIVAKTDDSKWNIKLTEKGIEITPVVEKYKNDCILFQTTNNYVGVFAHSNIEGSGTTYHVPTLYIVSE